MFKSQQARIGIGLLPLRVVVGFGFAAHGYAKLNRGPEKFAVILAAMGVPQPHVTAWITAVIEFAGGVGLMAGMYVVPLSIPLIAIMLTAMFKVHLPYGFSSVTLKAMNAAGAQFGPVGYELNLLYIMALAALALCSPGRFSIDALRATNRANRASSRGPESQCACQVDDAEANLIIERE